MSIIARDILQRARTLLQDASSTRWPLPELTRWLNDGLRELPMRSPSVTTVTTVLALMAGTRQAVPPAYASLIRAVRNVTPMGLTYIGGIAVTAVARELLDAQNPDWHNPQSSPHLVVVRHIIMDPFDQATFYVYPGNTGTGHIECMVSAILEPIALAAGADAADIDAYDHVIAIPSIFQSTMVDYVMYRALSKDMQLAGAAERAAAHFAQFSQALETRRGLETVYTPNSTNS